MRSSAQLLRSRAHVRLPRSFVRCSGRVRPDVCRSRGVCSGLCRSGRVRSDLRRSRRLRSELLRSRAVLLQHRLRWLQSEEALVPRLVRQVQEQLQEEPLLRFVLRWLRSDLRRSGRVRSQLRRSELRRSYGRLLPLVQMPEPASVQPHG